MSDIKSKILKGSFIDIFGTILSTIISFVIIRLYFQIITKEEFGIWLAINGVASLIAIVDLGVDQYFTTLIANDKTFYDKTFNVNFSNALVIKVFVAVFFLVVGVIMFILLENIITIPGKIIFVAKETFIINILYLIINIFFNSANSILLGRNHFSLVNSILILSSIGSSITTYFLLKFSYGIISFPLALLLISIIQFFIMLYVIRQKYPHISLGKVNLKGKNEMISYSFSFQILRWAHIIRTQYIIIAINNYVGPMYVTIYNMTNKIPQMVPMYFNKIVMPLFPSLAKYVSEHNYDAIRKIVIKLNKVLFRFSIFFCIAVSIFNKYFVYLWVGDDKYAGKWVEIWLIIYMLAFSAFCGFGIIIYSTKKFEKWTLLSIIEIFLVMILSYILNKYYGFSGIIGGFVLGSILTQFYIAIIALRQIGLSLSLFLTEIYKYILYPNIISLVVGFLINKYFMIDGWAELIYVATFYTISHFLFYEGMRFTISKEEDIRKRLINSFSI